MNLLEAIEYLNNIKQSESEKGKKSFGLELVIADNEPNVVGYITKYYNDQLIACKMKYCPTKKKYEIIIWWD